MQTGEFEVMASNITILNKAKTPPFSIEEDTKAGDDIRLKYRYLDLRRTNMTRNLKLRSKTTRAIRHFLDDHEFLDIETPFLGRSTPEGARDYLVPSRVHPATFMHCHNHHKFLNNY